MATVKLAKMLSANMLTNFWALEYATQSLIGANQTYALGDNGTLTQTNISIYRDMNKIDTDCPHFADGQWVVPAGYSATSNTCLPTNALILEDAEGEQVTIGCFGDNDAERIADCSTKLRPFLINTLTTSHSSNVSLVRRDDDHVAAIVGSVVGVVAGLPAIAAGIYASVKVHASKSKVDLSKPKMEGYGNGGLCGLIQQLEDIQYSTSEIVSRVSSDSVVIELSKNPEFEIGGGVMGSLPLKANIEAARAATTTFASQIAEGRSIDDAFEIAREIAGIRAERDGIGKAPEAARTLRPSKQAAALADEIKRSRSDLGIDYNEETGQIVDHKQNNEPKAARKTPFREPARDRKGKGRAQPVYDPVPRPENYRQPRVTQEIAAEPAAAGPSKERQLTKIELEQRNVFNKEWRAKIKANYAEMKYLSSLTPQERIAEMKQEVAQHETHSKIADTQAAQAVSRKEELLVLMAEADDLIANAETRGPLDAANARMAELQAEYDLVVAKEQAAEEQTREDLAEVVSLKSDIVIAEEFRQMVIQDAKTPGGYPLEDDLSPEAEVQRKEIREALEPANAAVDDVLWVIEARDGFETSAEQRHAERMVREMLRRPESPLEVPITETGIGGSQGIDQGSGGGAGKQPTQPQPPSQPEPPTIPEPPAQPAPPTIPEAPAPPAPPAPEPPVVAPGSPLDVVPKAGSNRPGTNLPGSSQNSAPSIAEQVAEAARRLRARNPKTEAAQKKLDDAMDPKHEVFEETWEKQSAKEDFWRTWDPDFKFERAADYWQRKGDIELNQYGVGDAKLGREYAKKATILRNMKTRYEAFDRKYPGFKNQGLRPPPKGPMGGTVDGTTDPNQPEEVKHDTVPDVDYHDIVKQNALPEIKLPPGVTPGGTGSGGGLPGIIEGERPGEGIIPEEVIVPHEPIVFHPDEKRKRARRGQGFGPRRVVVK